MPNNVRPPFDPGKQYVARRSFRFHGKDYSVGADFDWRTRSCSQRKARLLYDGGYLEDPHAVAPEKKVSNLDKPRKTRKPKAKKVKKVEKSVEDTDVEAEIDDFVAEQTEDE